MAGEVGFAEADGQDSWSSLWDGGGAPALESAVWTGVLAVPLGSQVTPGKSQNLSEPQTFASVK